MKIGDEMNFVETIRKNGSAVITMKRGTIVAKRTVKQVMVKTTRPSKNIWVDDEIIEEITKEG